MRCAFRRVCLFGETNNQFAKANLFAKMESEQLSTTFVPKTSPAIRLNCPEYDVAVSALNSLQTVKEPKNTRKQSQNIAQMMEQWLIYLGYSLADLDRLNIIHVSGTKGKGSTCALVESMLRHCGFKTGLFTSPHLRNARERFRVSGMPISPESFAVSFTSVHDRLKQNSKIGLPGYFHFLTLMAFDLFFSEKVDVAVIEVGIGGEYDATNVISRPAVCGVSALGLDHVAVLGRTLSEIAWHKAGIFKSGVPAFTEAQPEEAMQVLENRAAKAECSLAVVPDYESYFSEHCLNSENCLAKLGLAGKVQCTNASLALQLVNAWLQHNEDKETIHCFDGQISEATPFRPTVAMLDGLRNCIWPGRYQCLSRGPFHFWIDGAHTRESMELCGEWFFSDVNRDMAKVLIFNTTGPRDSEELISILKQIGSEVNESFSAVFFSPTIPRLPPPLDWAYKEDHYKEQVARCESMAENWLAANANAAAFATKSVQDAIILIEKHFPDGCQILTTGSLHLAGSLLEAIDEPVA